MSRKKGSPILGGILFVIIGVGLIWDNEKNLLQTDTSLNEAKKEYVEVSNTKINYSNDNKLIVTSGDLDKTTQTVTDPIFNITTDGNKLKRTVEMYQVDEDCDTDSDGNKQCKTEYVWSEDLIDSTYFDTPEENPKTKPYESETYYATNLKLGDYQIDEDLIKQLPTKEKVLELNQTTALEKQMTIVDNAYTTVIDNTPKIGDIRITYTTNKATAVTVMGMQKDTKIEPYITSNGYSVKILREGNLKGDELIINLKQENSNRGWIGRIIGFLITSIGILLMLSFINKLTMFIPVLGNIVGRLSIGISFALGMIISLGTIAVAWIRYKPIISIGLIAIIGIIVFGLIKLKNKKQQEPVIEPPNNINNQIPNINNDNINQQIPNGTYQQQVPPQQPMYQNQNMNTYQQPLNSQMQQQNVNMYQQPVQQPPQNNTYQQPVINQQSMYQPQQNNNIQ